MYYVVFHAHKISSLLSQPIQRQTICRYTFIVSEYVYCLYIYIYKIKIFAILPIVVRLCITRVY